MATDQRTDVHVELQLPLEVDYCHPSGGHSQFLFVRHGRTDGNVRRILVGRTDIPLDWLGYRQAEAVAEYVTTLPRPDVIIASPLLRARETAEAMARRFGLPIEIEADVAELNFGAYEGWTFEEIRTRHPDFATSLVDLEFDTHWPEGERLSEFHRRTRNALAKLARLYASHKAIVVTHGGFLGSLAAQLLRTPPNDWPRYQFRNASLTHLEVTADRSVFHRFNDDAHLGMLDPEAAR